MIGLVLMSFLLIPIMQAFGIFFGSLIFMMFFGLFTGVIGHGLKLIAFPLVEALFNTDGTGRPEECMGQLKHGFYALPLSFAAASLWTMMLYEVLDNNLLFIPIFSLVTPATIIIMIISVYQADPIKSLVRSAVVFLIVVIAFFLVAPGLWEKSQQKRFETEDSNFE